MTKALEAAAQAALAMVPDGGTVGLGTGRAAAAFIAALGARVSSGFAASGVPTSASAAALARVAGIPIAALKEGHQLDLTVDGADEVAPNLDVVKGRGGALVRERIVAAASKRQVILVSDDKLVKALGERGDIPIEIIPMAAPLVAHRVRLLGMRPTLRMGTDGTSPLVTENGNLTLNCNLAAPLQDGESARQMEITLRSIPGVVDTGLFLGTVEQVLVGYPDGRVDVLVRAARGDEKGHGGRGH